MPRSSSTICVQTLSKKARSWVIKITEPWYSLSNSSNQAIESKSKWLVGSSSKSTSGISTKARARATRFLVPPESVLIFRSASRWRRSRVSWTRCSQFQPLRASSWDCTSSRRWWEASSHSPTLSASYSSRKAFACATPLDTASKTVSSASKIGSWGT